MITLYGYWRSSAAYRVRIALNLKGIDYNQVAVHLVRDGGEQHAAPYAALNPAQLVPVLVDGDLVLHQSIAILDYLERQYPEVPLLPDHPAARAKSFAIAQDIACDIHPLDNLRVMAFLEKRLEVDEAGRRLWYAHWIERGFTALEERLAGGTDPYCVGGAPTWADVCLVPQVYNARRYEIPMGPYPAIRAIADRCERLDAFRRAAPENQPDAVTA